MKRDGRFAGCGEARAARFEIAESDLIIVDQRHQPGTSHNAKLGKNASEMHLHRAFGACRPSSTETTRPRRRRRRWPSMWPAILKMSAARLRTSGG